MTPKRTNASTSEAGQESEIPQADSVSSIPDPITTGITEADCILVDLSSSCTKDVAVAKLLGWMRGPIRRRYVEMTEDGIPLEQMDYLHTLEGTLADTLAEIRAGAQRRLSEAFDAEADEDEMDIRLAEVQKCDEMIYRAAQYTRDIDDELSKNSDNVLRIDERETARTGDVHINLSSLDQWAIEKYGIAVVEPATTTISQAGTNATGAGHVTTVKSAFGKEDPLTRSEQPNSAKVETKPNQPSVRRRMPDQEEAILRELDRLGYSPQALPPSEPDKPGVKANVRKALAANPLFKATTAFDKAWERLRKEKSIVDKT